MDVHRNAGGSSAAGGRTDSAPWAELSGRPVRATPATAGAAHRGRRDTAGTPGTDSTGTGTSGIDSTGTSGIDSTDTANGTADTRGHAASGVGSAPQRTGDQYRTADRRHRRTLAGVRVLVPRASSDHPICTAVAARGGIPVPLPLTRLAPAEPAAIGHALAMLPASAWVAFLAARAVTVLAEDRRPVASLVEVARTTSDLKVAAADRRIALALKGLGIEPDLVAHPEGIVSLAAAWPVAAVPEPDRAAARAPLSAAAALLGDGPAPDLAALDPVSARRPRVVLLGSDAVDPRLTTAVRERGWDVEAIALYRTVPAPLEPAVVAKALAYRSAGRARWPGVVVLTSAATFRALVASVGLPPAQVAVAAADEATARAAHAEDVAVHAIAAHPTAEGFAHAASVAYQRHAAAQQA